MKNILLITPLYPLPTKENNCTYVCHYFTREWVKMGYNVIVIHTQPVYCWLWHQLVRYFGRQIKNWAGGGNFYARKIKETEHYVMDGVPVYRIPVYNFLPHGRYPQKSVDNLAKEVFTILKNKRFTPDIITGHALPLEIIPAINCKYSAKTCMVEHGVLYKVRERYPNYRELIDSYDLWGFRNKSNKMEVEKNFGVLKHTFYCLSGIPACYITDGSPRNFKTSLSRFLFIGELIERKYPSVLLDAIPRACTGDYSITFIGEGPERSKMESIIAEKHIEGNVVFTGKIARDKIVNYLDDSECFVMISRGEAYGLVYLEAMARGCLVIASRDEGFDGIIVHGENGFLCESGDSSELSAIISQINKMSPDRRKQIAINGLKTAQKMTDVLVAKDYIKELEKL